MRKDPSRPTRLTNERERKLEVTPAGSQRLLGTLRPRLWIGFGVGLFAAGVVLAVASAINVAAGLLLVFLLALLSAFMVAVGVWSLRHPDQARRIVERRQNSSDESLLQHPRSVALVTGSMFGPLIGLNIDVRTHSVWIALVGALLGAMFAMAVIRARSGRAQRRLGRS